MITREFVDGISFEKDDLEIAFYSRFAKNVCFYPSNIDTAYHKMAIGYGTVLPIEDVMFITNGIQEYNKKLNETNKESHKEDLINILSNGDVPAMKDGELCECCQISCEECDWYDDNKLVSCGSNRAKWMNETK